MVLSVGGGSVWICRNEVNRWRSRMLDDVGRGEEVSAPGMLCRGSMVLTRGPWRWTCLNRGAEEEQLEAVEFTFECQEVDRAILCVE